MVGRHRDREHARLIGRAEVKFGQLALHVDSRLAHEVRDLDRRDEQLRGDGEGGKRPSEDQDDEQDPWPDPTPSLASASRAGGDTPHHGALVIGEEVIGLSPSHRCACSHTGHHRAGTRDDGDLLGELIDRGRPERLGDRSPGRIHHDRAVDQARERRGLRQDLCHRCEPGLEGLGIESSLPIRKGGLHEDGVERTESVVLRQGLAHPSTKGRDQRVFSEGNLSGDRLIEDEGQRVDVSLAVDWLPLRLLGRCIADGADHRAGRFGPRCFGKSASHAEVGDPQAALRVEEKIRRLHVSVHQPARVRVGQASSCLTTDPHSLLWAHCDPGVKEILERSTGEQLGDQIRHAVLFTPVIDLEDGGMVERGHCSSLGLESLQERLILRKCRLEELDRDLSLQRGVLSPIDDGRGTGAEDALDAISASEDPTDVVRGGDHERLPT